VINMENQIDKTEENKLDSLIKKRIGDTIRNKREEFGYTQAKLAEEIGRTSSFIGQIERGDAMPSLETLSQLTQLLGIDANSYFYEKSNQNQEVREFSLMMEQLPPKIRKLTFEIIKQVYKYGR